MKRLNLKNITLELQSDESVIDSFHPDAVWSIYDSTNNIFSAQKQTYFDFHAAMHIASEIAESGEQVTVRWEAESLEETLTHGLEVIA